MALSDYGSPFLIPNYFKNRLIAAASIWFEIWWSWIRVEKKPIFSGKFPKDFTFFWEEIDFLGKNFE